MLGVVVELFLVMGLTWAAEIISLAVNWSQRATHLGRDRESCRKSRKTYLYEVAQCLSA
jgi:hypothetical protein